MTHKLGLLHQWVTFHSINYVFFIWLSKKIIQIFNPWNNPFVIHHTTNYSIPDKYTRPTLCIHSHPLPPHLCCCWVIKIPPNRMIKTLTVFVYHSLYYPPSILSELPTEPSHYIYYTPLENSLTTLHTKNWKGGYHMMWCTHNPNMHQTIKIHGRKLP